MKILGARVVEVTDGLQTLKEAVDAAFAAYCREYKDMDYIIGRYRKPVKKTLQLFIHAGEKLQRFCISWPKTVLRRIRPAHGIGKGCSQHP